MSTYLLRQSDCKQNGVLTQLCPKKISVLCFCTI